MKFKQSPEGLVEFASAKARIIETARLLEKNDITEESKFSLCWSLANSSLRNLETFRIPD